MLVFAFISHMGMSAQQKSFCVLQFSKTKSIISVSLAFQRHCGVAAPCAKNICRWYKQFDKTGCLCKRKTAWQSRTSDEAVLKVQEIFFLAKSTRRASQELVIHRSTVWCVLRRRLIMRPYKFTIQSYPIHCH